MSISISPAVSLHAIIYAYIHTCIHAYMHAFIYAYIYTCIHSYMHTFIHVNTKKKSIAISPAVSLHTFIYAYIHICIHSYMHSCIYTCIHICIHLYMHTFIYVNTKEVYLYKPNSLSPNSRCHQQQIHTFMYVYIHIYVKKSLSLSKQMHTIHSYMLTCFFFFRIRFVCTRACITRTFLPQAYHFVNRPQPVMPQTVNLCIL